MKIITHDQSVYLMDIEIPRKFSSDSKLVFESDGRSYVLDFHSYTFLGCEDEPKASKHYIIFGKNPPHLSFENDKPRRIVDSRTVYLRVAVIIDERIYYKLRKKNLSVEEQLLLFRNLSLTSVGVKQAVLLAAGLIKETEETGSKTFRSLRDIELFCSTIDDDDLCEIFRGASALDVEKQQWVVREFNRAFYDKYFPVKATAVNFNAILKRIFISKSNIEKLEGAFNVTPFPRILMIGDREYCKDVASAISSSIGYSIESKSLASISRACDISGDPTNYASALPSLPLKLFYKAGTSRMSLFLSNLDNLSHERQHGDPWIQIENLLQGSFEDSFFEKSIDLDHTLLFFHSNSDRQIGHITDDFTVVVNMRLSDNQKSQAYLTANPDCGLSLSALENVATSFTTDYGLSQLSRAISFKNASDNAHEETTCSPFLEFKKHASLYSPEIAEDINECQSELLSLSRSDPEYKKCSLRLKTLAKLKSLPKPDFDLGKARDILSHHVGNEDIKFSFIEHRLSEMVNAKNDRIGLRFLFIGPGGCGKTSLAELLQKASGCSPYVIDMSIVDTDLLSGVGNQYGESFPSIFSQHRQKVIILDEIDKAPSSVLNALLRILANGSYYDKNLQRNIDIDGLDIIACANSADLPSFFLDRFEVFYMTLNARKKELLFNTMLANELSEYKNNNIKITVPEDIKSEMFNTFLSTPGTGRDVNRLISSTIKKAIAKKFGSEASITTVELSTGDIPEYVENVVQSLPFAGKSSAVFVTATGNSGTSSVTSAYNDSGTEKLWLTGCCDLETIGVQAELAIQCIRPDAPIHVHIDGDNPKKGSSIGMAMFASLFSLVHNVLIPSEYAFTGELGLNHEINPIGAILEKADACLRESKTHFFVPSSNLEKISVEDQAYYNRHGLTLIGISTIDELSSYLVELAC